MMGPAVTSPGNGNGKHFMGIGVGYLWIFKGYLGDIHMKRA